MEYQTTEQIVAALRARTRRTLPAEWQKGRVCPECDAAADRPKCMWESGANCPRHDPENYEPSPYVVVPDPLCSAAADQIERLVQGLSALISDCDNGRHYASGAGGMTVEAQIARTLINGVSAKVVEQARECLQPPYPED